MNLTTKTKYNMDTNYANLEIRISIDWNKNITLNNYKKKSP